MIAFIFVIMTLMLLFLIFSFAIGNYTLAMISSMGLIVLSVYITTEGIETMDNLLTQAIALICFGVGVYVLIRGTTETAMEHLDNLK